MPTLKISITDGHPYIHNPGGHNKGCSTWQLDLKGEKYLRELKLYQAGAHITHKLFYELRSKEMIYYGTTRPVRRF